MDTVTHFVLVLPRPLAPLSAWYKPLSYAPVSGDGGGHRPPPTTPLVRIRTHVRSGMIEWVPLESCVVLVHERKTVRMGNLCPDGETLLPK